MTTSSAAKPVTLRQWETLTRAILILDGVLAALFAFIAVAIGATRALSGAERVALTALSLASLPVALRWVKQTRQLLLSLGDDAKRMGHWSSTASLVLVISANGANILLHKTPLFAALLAVAAVPSMLTVLNARKLVRGVAAGEIAPQAPDPQPEQPAARKPQQPAAHDDFW